MRCGQNDRLRLHDVDGGSGNKGGSGEQRGGGDGLTAALAECAGELGVGDEAIDAFAESGGLRHGHHAGGRLLRGLRSGEAVAHS